LVNLSKDVPRRVCTALATKKSSIRCVALDAAVQFGRLAPGAAPLSLCFGVSYEAARADGELAIASIVRHIPIISRMRGPPITAQIGMQIP
jgi:hypothetical protein